jgi:hypothetical protein
MFSRLSQSVLKRMTSGVMHGVKGGARRTTSKANSTKANPAGDNTMGAILRFVLFNVVSVIGARLINHAANMAADKVLHDKEQKQNINAQNMDAKTAHKTLDAQTCPHCGAFLIKGETCACRVSA